jgi:hypothetical protein
MSRRILLFLLLSSTAGAGEVKHATPETYRRLLTTLRPGDTLRLEAGVYDRGLPVTGCNGTPEAWITIEGPETGVAEIRQTQVANCVELRDSIHVALKRLAILGEGPGGTPGLFGISAKGGPENRVHHILIEDCLISDWNTSQQAVGISTKTPTWDWTIRRNVIRRCGTGLYLGNSNGADPFIRGVIEHNLVEDPVGYCMEIKFQNARTSIPGMPESACRTLIRHNGFIKDGTPSPDGDRPNVLVGGFPASGPGSDDLYEIHGNVFWNNPREALLQASGRASIHDNLFLGDTDTRKAAIALRDHDLPLRRAHVYHNTIVSHGEGIRVAAKGVEDLVITANALFTEGDALVLNGAEGRVGENLTGTKADAAKHLANPAAMAFYPLAGAAMGPPLDPALFRSDTASSLDFDGVGKGESRHHGAFASPDPAGRWRIQRGIKPAPSR